MCPYKINITLLIFYVMVNITPTDLNDIDTSLTNIENNPVTFTLCYSIKMCDISSFN